MNNDQLYYFLVDKNTRNLIRVEYPSDVDEFNKILGTSEGKGDLLKALGVIKDTPIISYEIPKVEETQINTIPVIEETKVVKPTKPKAAKKTESISKPAKNEIWNLF